MRIQKFLTLSFQAQNFGRLCILFLLSQKSLIGQDSHTYLGQGKEKIEIARKI